MNVLELIGRDQALFDADLARHPVLSGMAVMQRGNRLSVQSVTAEQWQAVLDLAGLSLRSEEC